MAAQGELFKREVIHYFGRTNDPGDFTACGIWVSENLRGVWGNRQALRQFVTCKRCRARMESDRRHRLAAGVPAELA